MDLKLFYDSIGVDYSRVLNRLMKEDRIEKYLGLLIKDPSFSSLKEAVRSRDYKAAFAAAHTVKGVCLNLELKPLADAASNLVEYLRGKEDGDIDQSHLDHLYREAETSYLQIKEFIDRG